MDLTMISNSELLNRVEKLTRSERKITHLILWHLVEVETRRLYLDLGYTSLFKYLTNHLSYSEDAAYRRIQASKLLKKMPQLETSIENGELNLTQLTQVQKCLNSELENGNKITVEKTESILEQIHNKSSFETKKILAVEFNQPIQIHEILNPQRDESVRMEITFTEDQMKELQHAKDLLSHILPNPTWAELISYLAQAQIKKKLGTAKIATREKAVSKEPEILRDKIQDTPKIAAGKSITPTKTELLPIQFEMLSNESGWKAIHRNRDATNSNRKHIKLSTRRILLKKSELHCEFIHANGERCNSSYQLQIDHKMPLALGGTNEMENFRVLCRTHNLAEARRMGLN